MAKKTNTRKKVGAGKAKLKQILEAAAQGYNDSIARLPTLAEARKHTAMDSLADFIVLELHDVVMGSENPVEEASNAIGTAIEQLERVRLAIDSLTDDGEV